MLKIIKYLIIQMIRFLS